MEFTTHLELHSQATRLFETVPYECCLSCRRVNGVVTLSDPAFQRSYRRPHSGRSSLHYNSDGEARQNDFQFELFPLHSPLLRESLLVSFPPLSYMLKSSGSSYLISGPNLKKFRWRGHAHTHTCVCVRALPLDTLLRRRPPHLRVVCFSRVCVRPAVAWRGFAVVALATTHHTRLLQSASLTHTLFTVRRPRGACPLPFSRFPRPLFHQSPCTSSRHPAHSQDGPTQSPRSLAAPLDTASW